VVTRELRLDDVGGLDDPGQPAFVLAGAVAADVGEAASKLSGSRLEIAASVARRGRRPGR
jgi:hypothetical protein